MTALIASVEAQKQLKDSLSSLPNVSYVDVQRLTDSEQDESSNWILTVSAKIKVYKLFKWWFGEPTEIVFTVQGTYQIKHEGFAQLNVDPERENAEPTYVLWKFLDCETIMSTSGFDEFKLKLGKLLCP